MHLEALITMSLVFATTFFFVFYLIFFLGGGGGGGGVLRRSAVQTDFEFEISGPLIHTKKFTGAYPDKEREIK